MLFYDFSFKSPCLFLDTIIKTYTMQVRALETLLAQAELLCRALVQVSW